MTDHYPTGHAAEKLSQRFGVDMSKGTTTDPSHTPTGENGGTLNFSRDDKLLGEHPILRGRNAAEYIRRVITFTGQSLKGPAGSVALLKLSDTAVDHFPSGADDSSGTTGAATGGRRNRRQPSAIAEMPTASAAGRSQGLALRFGRGRVVVLGEASQITAELAGPRKRPMGMNYPDCDNRQWTLNIMHWLSGLLDSTEAAAGTPLPQPIAQPAMEPATGTERRAPLNLADIPRVDRAHPPTREQIQIRTFILKTVPHAAIGEGYVIITDHDEQGFLQPLQQLARFHSGTLLQVTNLADFHEHAESRAELKQRLLQTRPRFVAIAPKLENFHENLLLSMWEVLASLDGSGQIGVCPGWLVAPDQATFAALIERSIHYKPQGGTGLRPFVMAQVTDPSPVGERALGKLELITNIFDQLGYPTPGLVIRAYPARQQSAPESVEPPWTISATTPHQLIQSLPAAPKKALDEASLVVGFGHGVPGMTCGLDVAALQRVQMTGKVFLCGSCFSAFPLHTYFPAMRSGSDGSGVRQDKERIAMWAVKNGANVVLGHMRENGGFPELYPVLEAWMEGLTVGAAYQRQINAILDISSLAPDALALRGASAGNSRAVQERNELLYVIIGDPALQPLAKLIPPPSGASAPAAPASASTASAPVTQAFEGRDWLLGINATVSADEGRPVISIKGQAGGSADRAQPIGHIAFAKGLALKEGAIEFELKSAQLNRVGHNYIGVIFRVQDSLHYEVLYFRFCPGQLAGIQFASVSDGTDPWQKFQQPQYTRPGVFPDKTWIKIRIELRGERMLLYMNGAAKPALDIAHLPGGYPAGSVGFWAFPTSGEGMFRNLRVMPGPLTSTEPPSGELADLPAPSAAAAIATASPPTRQNQRDQRAQMAGSNFRLEPSSQPGSIDRAQWARRQMQNSHWQMSDLEANAVTKGLLKAAGSEVVQRSQIIYKAVTLTGDFDLTAQYRGNSRIGLVCADGQRGYIGIQNAVAAWSELRIRRTGRQLTFTLNGQPAAYTKALTREDVSFYFGAVLDNGMQCEIAGIKVTLATRP